VIYDGPKEDIKMSLVYKISEAINQVLYALWRKEISKDLKRGKNNKTCIMPSCGMLRHVALVRTDVSEGHIASIIRVTRIGNLGTAILMKDGVFWDVTPCDSFMN
jgi:hypothetical protein